MTVLAVHWEDENGRSAGSGSIEQRASALAAEIRRLPGRIVLLGHSLGGLIAAETARQMERDSARSLPERVVICAAAAPGTPHSFPSNVLAASDVSMTRYARDLGGTPEEILTDPEFGPEILALLRSDLDLIERYYPVLEPPLSLPVSVYGGASDSVVPAESLKDWRRFAPLARFRVFPGGHFFLHDTPAEVCLGVVADCDQPEPQRGINAG
jgi:surfactin synthase thioesterase subunit